MKYLGLPISDRHLGAQSFWGWVIEKMRKKLSPLEREESFFGWEADSHQLLPEQYSHLFNGDVQAV